MSINPEQYHKITALICTLNEEQNLPHVLPRIPAWVSEVPVIDGHSTDRTVEVARKIRPDIRILRQPGRGKGNALKYGVEQATGDIVVTLGADGSTDPDDMPRFISPLLEGCDFVKGPRLSNLHRSNMPRHHRLGNKVGRGQREEEPKSLIVRKSLQDTIKMPGFLRRRRLIGLLKAESIFSLESMLDSYSSIYEDMLDHSKQRTQFRYGRVE